MREVFRVENKDAKTHTDYDRLLELVREAGMDYKWAAMFVKKLKDDENEFIADEKTKGKQSGENKLQLGGSLVESFHSLESILFEQTGLTEVVPGWDDGTKAKEGSRMEPPGNHSHCHIDKRNHHIAAIQDGRSLKADEHGKGPDPRSPVGFRIQGVVGMKDRNGHQPNGDGEHQCLRYISASNGISGTQYRKDAEDKEYVSVSKGVVFKERIQHREQYAHSSSYQEPWTA